MNLADAIRKAALAASHAEGRSEVMAEAGKPAPAATPEPAPAEETTVQIVEDLTTQTEAKIQEKESDMHEIEPTEVEETYTTEATAYAEHETGSDAPQAPTGPVTAVRLELFLAPEQIANLLRSVGNTQHSVLTLREAAAFLRMPAANMEKLALDREIPAFQVDGKWRFSRAALEEWLGEQGRKRDSA